MASDAAASGLAAAWWHGLTEIRARHRRGHGARDSNGRPRPGIHLRRRDLAPADVVERRRPSRHRTAAHGRRSSGPTRRRPEAHGLRAAAPHRAPRSCGGRTCATRAATARPPPADCCRQPPTARARRPSGCWSSCFARRRHHRLEGELPSRRLQGRRRRSRSRRSRSRSTAGPSTATRGLPERPQNARTRSRLLGWQVLRFTWLDLTRVPAAGHRDHPLAISAPDRDQRTSAHEITARVSQAANAIQKNTSETLANQRPTGFDAPSHTSPTSTSRAGTPSASPRPRTAAPSHTPTTGSTASPPSTSRSSPRARRRRSARATAHGGGDHRQAWRSPLRPSESKHRAGPAPAIDASWCARHRTSAGHRQVARQIPSTQNTTAQKTMSRSAETMANPDVATLASSHPPCARSRSPVHR